MTCIILCIILCIHFTCIILFSVATESYPEQELTFPVKEATETQRWQAKREMIARPLVKVKDGIRTHNSVCFPWSHIHLAVNENLGQC